MARHLTLRNLGCGGVDHEKEERGAEIDLEVEMIG